MTNEEIKMLLVSRLEKTAAGSSPISDTLLEPLGHIPLMLIPGGDIISRGISLGSQIGGMAAPTAESERKNLNTKASKALSLIPGIGTYRNAKRRKELAIRMAGGQGYEKPVSEIVGATTNKVLPILLGTTVGYMKDKGEGAWKGALIGAGATGILDLIGMLTAAITKRRNKAEQQTYEQSKDTTIANYLLPGFAAYNYWKNVGYMQGEANNDKQRAKAKELLKRLDDEKSTSDQA